MIKTRRTQAGVALGVLAIAAVALSACSSADTGGSSSKSSGKSSTTTSSAPAVGGSSAAAGAGALLTDSRLPKAPTNLAGADVAAAQKAVLAGLAKPTFTAPGSAFDIKKVTKPVWFITATSQFPVVPIVNQAFTDAAKAAGVKVHICPGNSVTSQNALCIQQAINAHAGSLLFFSQDPKDLAKPLADARKAGIKIVSGNNALKIGDPTDAGTDASVSHNYYGTGLLNGAYAVAKWGADVDALCVTLPQFKVTISVCNGFSTAVKQYCPKCKVVVKGIDAAQLANQLTATVNSQLLGDPKTDFVFGSVDGLCGIIGTQLTRNGKSPTQVTCAGQNGDVDAWTSLRKKGFEGATVAQDTFWWGWAFFDAAARAQVGAIGDKAVITAPNVLMTTESFNYTGPIDFQHSDQIIGVDPSLYQNGFKNLWKG